jgi:hypothetical protein
VTRLVLTWLALSVPAAVLIGRFLRSGAEFDHAEVRALAALEELWQR